MGHNGTMSQLWLLTTPCGRPIRRRWPGRWYFIDLFIPYACPDCDFTTDWKNWRPL